MQLLANLARMQRDQDEEMRPQLEHGGEVRNPRALLLWRRMTSKLRELMQIFEGNERPERVALPEGGSSSGYLLAVSAQASMMPMLPSFQGHSTKQELIANQIKTGIPLPPRKCQQAPRVPAAVCNRPTNSLSGSGNQHQKEVWCTDCHARWKVETTVRAHIGPIPLTPKTPPQTTMSTLRNSLEGPALSTPTSSMATMHAESGSHGDSL